MTPVSDEAELDPMDELGSLEAMDVPEGDAEEADPVPEDENYDESLSSLDPDEQGGDLPHSEEEWDQ